MGMPLAESPILEKTELNLEFSSDVQSENPHSLEGVRS